VLLTGEYAYKVKKPVDLGFLDFRELEQRRFYCEEELRLNRFWAPELYLDVVPIGMRAGRPRIGGDGPAIEYAVRMRQFDQALRLDHQLEAGRLAAADMRELAEEIAARHLAADRVEADDRLLAATKRLMRENFDDLAGELPEVRLDALRRWTEEAVDRHEALLRERCDEGFYRECHGDLHLGNIVRLAGGIKAFDCIEFSEELRRIDVVADYGFLVMDLVARDRTDLAYAFLNRYLEVTGDYAGVTLLPLYVVYRCLVRAKVAAIRRRERGPGASREEDGATLAHYAELARRWTAPARPVLVAMHGLSGSGKTWLSDRLLTRLPAVRIRSDLERKRLFGLGETADSHSGVASGIYTREAGEAVYARLHELARKVLGAGFNVILDAAYLDRARRERAMRVAAQCDADFRIVHASAREATLTERAPAHALDRGDASEADIEVLRWQLANQEPLTDVESPRAVTVATDAAIDIAAVVEAIARRIR
jgi:aminoglycoside phosphotransferase family enzyme